MRHAAVLVGGLCLAACTTLPDVAEPQRLGSADPGYTDFVPIDRVVLEDRDASARALETEEQLEARLAVLRARAARLRAVPFE